MELLGGIKKKTEQRKAYKFYQQMPKLQGHLENYANYGL